MLIKKLVFRIFSMMPVLLLIVVPVSPASALPAPPTDALTPSEWQFTKGGNDPGSASGNMLNVPGEVVGTGITNIQEFLTRCPTNDPAYNQIRQDFELRINGALITYPITCSEPVDSIPIAQYTDELIALQTLRTAYYMGMGTAGKLPWTSEDLYSWMKGNIAGINLKTAPGQLYCCDVIDGRKYFSYSRQDDFNRDFKRTWKGISITLDFYAHEIRHADPGAPGHTTGCPAFPSPGGPLGCDATYSISNLGSYGVQYWLESSWATGYLNIGIGCAPPATAMEYVNWNAQAANGFIARFVSNPPPGVTPSTPYGGPCTIFADVSSTYWSVSYVERLYLAGITGGCTLNPLMYCPEDSVTRAQMAVFLLRGIHTSAYAPPGVGAGTGFGDVPTDYWSGAWIKQLAAEGITTGCGNGNYCPEHPVTRAQMAVFLLRSKYGASYIPPAVGAGTGFGDVPPDYWSAAWIKQLVTEGITSGCGGGNYCPEQPVTRAQMAVFLVKTFSLP